MAKCVAQAYCKVSAVFRNLTERLLDEDALIGTYIIYIFFPGSQFAPAVGVLHKIIVYAMEYEEAECRTNSVEMRLPCMYVCLDLDSFFHFLSFSFFLSLSLFMRAPGN